MMSSDRTLTSRIVPPEGGLDPLFGMARARLGRFAAMRPFNRRRMGWLALFVLIGWAATGIYKVGPDEEAVVLRLGRRDTVAGPGIHLHLPYPVDQILLPSVTRINELQIGRSAEGPSRPSAMLTGDENIVEADALVLWRIRDSGDYLFNVADPERLLRVGAESAIREVIGRSPIQSAISEGRASIADATRAVLQAALDRDGAGIEITQVQLQRVDPPAQVIDAFNDLQRARSDGERARNDAEAYRNEILPRARAEATRITQEAKAYRTQVTSLAEGDAKGFRAVYEAYRSAPDVTAWRLYLDGLDEVLRRASRVVIDGTGKEKGAGLTPILQLGEDRARAAVKPDPAANKPDTAGRPAP